MVEEVTEIVSLEELKTFLKVTSEDWDDILELMIPAAIKKTEEYCGRKWISQEIEETKIGEGGNDIALNWAPVDGEEDLTVTIDGDETESFELRAGIARLHRDGYIWPAGAVIEITYTAGYGEAADVVADLPEVKIAIMATIASWYNNPESASSINISGVGSTAFDVALDLPATAKTMLGSLRRRFF